MVDTIDDRTDSIELWGCISRIPVGQGRCYVVGAQEIAVFRQRDGRLFATQNRCPHKQGPLSEGVMGGGQVICPLHAHRFELKDGAGTEPARVRQGVRSRGTQGRDLRASRRMGARDVDGVSLAPARAVAVHGRIHACCSTSG